METVFMIRIIDLAKGFTPGALPDATLTIYPGLGPALEKHWRELPGGCFERQDFQGESKTQGVLWQSKNETRHAELDYCQ